ncbi:MAG: cation transporter [Tannerella sp.]|jgi:Cu(I)/Ag(I) efflux system membrane fusion protein|nr:cation transporter [Tannerella sp.]
MKKLVFLVAAIVFIAANSVCVGSDANAENRTSAPASVKLENRKEVHKDLKVEGSCGMCKTRIEKTAKSVAGVTSAVWDQKSKKLHLDFDAQKTSLEAISKAVAKVGHDTEKDKTDDKTYDALPGCCKYRK